MQYFRATRNSVQDTFALPGRNHPDHFKVLSLVRTCSKCPDICSCLLAAWKCGARQISVSLKPQNVHESLGFRLHDASADL